MSTFAQNFEGFTPGTVLTSGATGGQSAIANVQGTLTATGTSPLTGSVSGELTLTTGVQYARFDNVGATGRCGLLMKFRYQGPSIGTSASIIVGRNTDSTEVSVAGVQISTGGLPQMWRGNAATAITESRPASPPLTAGQAAWVSMFYQPGASATTARLGYRLYAADGTTLLHEWAPATDYDVGTTGSIQRYRLGATNSTQWPTSTFVFDEVYGGDLPSGWLLPPTVDPTLVVVSTDSYTHDARTSTAGGGGALTYSIISLSGPDHTSGILEPIDGLFVIPKDSTSNSTYRITVTEGLRTDTEDVLVPAAVAPVITSDSTRRRIRIGGAWL